MAEEDAHGGVATFEVSTSQRRARESSSRLGESQLSRFNLLRPWHTGWRVPECAHPAQRLAEHLTLLCFSCDVLCRGCLGSSHLRPFGSMCTKRALHADFGLLCVVFNIGPPPLLQIYEKYCLVLSVSLALPVV